MRIQCKKNFLNAEAVVWMTENGAYVQEKQSSAEICSEKAFNFKKITFD